MFGDQANTELLLRALPDAEAVRTPLRARPAFLDRQVDLVYMGSMTERGQARAAAALAPLGAEIGSRIDGGARFLATGNSLEIFGKYIDCGDGERIEGLGLFDVYARRDMAHRYNGLFLGKYGDIDIVGFQSRFSHLYDTGNTPQAPPPADGAQDFLFETVRGAGRRPGDAREGLRRANFMATYVLGPLLILNPLFTKKLLLDMGAPPAELPFEPAAIDSYKARLREFENPNTGFEY